jgi:hypothetical protein
VGKVDDFLKRSVGKNPRPLNESPAEALGNRKVLFETRLAGGQLTVRVRLTEDLVIFDYLVGRDEVAQPSTALRVADVSHVEVADYQQARSEYGWRLTTGFLHGPTKIPALSAVVFHHGAGQQAVFLGWGPPVTVKAQVGPLLHFFDARRSTVPAPPSDELERLARLHNDGALTNEEFAAAKAKLLGL